MPGCSPPEQVNGRICGHLAIPAMRSPRQTRRTGSSSSTKPDYSPNRYDHFTSTDRFCRSKSFSVLKPLSKTRKMSLPGR